MCLPTWDLNHSLTLCCLPWWLACCYFIGVSVTTGCGGGACTLRDANNVIQYTCSGSGYQTCTIPFAVFVDVSPVFLVIDKSYHKTNALNVSFSIRVTIQDKSSWWLRWDYVTPLWISGDWWKTLASRSIVVMLNDMDTEAGATQQ